MNISKHEHSSPGNWRCSREHQQMKWWCYCNYKLEEFWSKFRFYKCIFEYKPLWCHWIWFWLISLQAPATKEQQRRPATLAVIFFTPIQEKAFFNLNLWIEKGKDIIIFYGKYAQAVWPPLMTSTRPWWPPATPCDLSIKLMVGTQKLGWFWRNLLCSFEYWRFFLSKTNNF